MDPRDGDMRAHTLLVVIALVVQFAIIGSVIAPPLLASGSGKTVRLKVTPVDPRDPLRGDYLAVDYEIGRAHDENVDLKKGQTVWMPLRHQGPVWVAAEPVFTHQPSEKELSEVGAGTVIKGRVASIKDRRISYGMDRYFVPEGKGQRFPSGTVIAEVSLGNDGTPVLKRILVNGRVWP